MGTIIERRRKNGSIAYLAQISIMRGGKSLRQSQTFDRRQAAAAWIRSREKDLEKPGAFDVALSGKANPTIGDAIRRYVDESVRQIGRTKAQVLRSILHFDIADIVCDRVTSADIVAFVGALNKRVKPQTAANYLSHLSAVFRIASAAWHFPLDYQVIRKAADAAKHLGMTDRSHKRARRPTMDELDRIMEWFAARAARKPGSAPMHAIVAFALFSTRRQEEITRLAWADLDLDGARILVRDMKHPGQKAGNDQWVDLPAPALRIIRSMPRNDDRIFPFDAGTISAAFTRACKVMAIDGLHFHDLRHEGVSRLFETGLSIPHAAAVSGHRSWSSLQRYTHVRQTGDRYAGWHWLDRIAPQ